jgi:Domain of unknown function (DUF4160)
LLNRTKITKSHLPKTQSLGYTYIEHVSGHPRRPRKQMPTIIRQNGFRIVIFPNDHIPPHVHVFKSGAEVKIDLGDEPSLLSVEGKIGNKDLAKTLILVVEHRVELLEKWREIHE